ETSAVKERSEVNKVIFACDAGMGSSAMGASLLQKRLKDADIAEYVNNSASRAIPADADIVITHKDLTAQAREIVSHAEPLPVANFLNSPKYTDLVERLKK